MTRLWISVCVAASATLVAATSALAQAPVEPAYGGEGGQVQQEVAGAAAGGLPFTGLDLLLMSVVAALLVGAGLTMRRFARTKI